MKELAKENRSRNFPLFSQRFISRALCVKWRELVAVLALPTHTVTKIGDTQNTAFCWLDNLGTALLGKFDND